MTGSSYRLQYILLRISSTLLPADTLSSAFFRSLFSYSWPEIVRLGLPLMCNFLWPLELNKCVCRFLQDSWVPTNYWQTASFEPPQEAQSLNSPPAESVVLPPLPPLAKGTLDKGTNEQAIVLYRPVNPPLFPGGPAVGSTDLPLKVDTAGISGCLQGYWQQWLY